MTDLQDKLWNVFDAKLHEAINECPEATPHQQLYAAIWVASYYLFKHDPVCCHRTLSYFSISWPKSRKDRWAVLWRSLTSKKRLENVT